MFKFYPIKNLRSGEWHTFTAYGFVITARGPFLYQPTMPIWILDLFGWSKKEAYEDALEHDWLDRYNLLSWWKTDSYLFDKRPDRWNMVMRVAFRTLHALHDVALALQGK